MSAINEQSHSMRASKRIRRAPKDVYDNDFEAHEIQDVRETYSFSSRKMIKGQPISSSSSGI
jgi:hypothetical protein